MVLIAAGRTIRLASLQRPLLAARHILCDEVAGLSEEAALRAEAEESVAVTRSAVGAVEEVLSHASSADTGVGLVALQAVALGRARRADIACQIKAKRT